ncbi:putative transport protein (probable polysaccharide biosynthesis transport protein) [Natrialba magadii ATCC 43099]|uniref:Polysaccharide biosynthesis protein n=1 Tax=Natrialba magadii (strain ATCC 43099 / DSM 3394 / CCM 3739 / CIP 104546 / IAM 13178 / JCM 8861 / NBRC 102185 / NCIMB 2190 / MS3) TaxID=547559 RepID=D3STC0_NATMM|nr:flippase [Natrialba magadii]ADD06987.1 putative transport protein (probable polysaccharide biosynthesis transport protein) [Natrialba magadii ATCC 43099]ELY28870.1 polysaccharide biosynthesis protein [Natrialba magadii ATCC 43099]
MKQQIIRGFRATLVAEIVRTIAKGVLMVSLASLFLTPDEYGLLFLAISVFSASLLFSRLGIPRSTARYLAEFRETDPGQVPYIIRDSLTFLTAVMLTVSILIAVFHQQLATLFGESDLAPLLALGVVYISCWTINSYVHTIFQGFNRIPWSARVTILTNVTTLVAVLVFLVAGFGVIGALTGYVLGYVLGAVYGLYLLSQLLGEFDAADEREPGLRRRLLEYSLPLTVSDGANVVYKQVDTLLIGFFLTPAAVGYYVLAKQISDFVIAPASSLGFTVSPSYGEYKANGELEKAADIYETTFKHSVLFYIPAAAGLIVVAEPLVQYVFGPEYLEAVLVIQIFAFFIVFQAIDKITNDALDYLGRAKHRAISKGVTGGFNFGLNLLLIPTIGIAGAAISTVVSYGIMIAVNIYLIRSELPVSLPYLGKSVVAVSGIALCMAAVVVVALPLVSNLVSLLALVAVGVLVWATISVTSGMLDVQNVLS